VLASFGLIQQVVVSPVANAARATQASKFGTIILRMVPGTPGDSGPGTGLGLSISHALVTGRGGTLTVTSEVGKGSTFRVELPVVPARA
jgi:light-regulated signal transduction histidine kinase (bacteriophytochrome)